MCYYEYNKTKEGIKMKWNKKSIIKNIEENGGLDMRYIRYTAERDDATARDYIVDYVKNGYNCHGNTANAVADYFLYGI